MNKKEFNGLVEKCFGFLIKEYGFSLAYSEYDKDFFGNCLVIVETKKLKIGISRDKGLIEIRISKGNVILNDIFTEGWYDILTVIQFLSKDSTKIKLNYPEPKGGQNIDESTESQMSEIAEMIKPYSKEVIDYFNNDRFDKESLEEFEEKITHKWLGNSYQLGNKSKK